jgi:hypothetical protein
MFMTQRILKWKKYISMYEIIVLKDENYYNLVQNGNVLSCNMLSAVLFLSDRSCNYSSPLSF